MDSFGSRIRLALIALMVLGAVPMAAPSGVVAQVATSQVLLGNVSVAWGAPWAKDTEASGAGQGWEQLWLDGASGSVLVETDIPPVPGEQLRADLLGAIGADTPVERVDGGNAGAASYSLDLVRYPGAPVGVLIVAQDDPAGTQLWMLVAGASLFADATAAAQVGITVGGAPIFGGMDGALMQQQLEAAAGQQAGTSAQVPAPTPAQGLVTAPTPTPAPVAPPTPTVAPVAPTAESASGTSGGDLPAGSFTMWLNDWVVNWNAGWQPRDQEDHLVVLWRPEIEVQVHFQADAGGVFEKTAAEIAADRAQALSDMDAPEEPWVVRSAVDLDNGQRHLIVVSRTSNGRTLYFIEEYVRRNEVQWDKILVQVWDTDLAAGVAAIQSGITVNGEPILTGLDITGLDTATASAPASETTIGMFMSDRDVAWTTGWVEAVVVPDYTRVVSPDEAVEYVVADRTLEFDPEYTAGFRATELTDDLRSQGTTDVRIHAALDLDGGRRMLIVVSWVYEGKRTYTIEQITRWDTLIAREFVQIEESRLASGLAEMQAGITIDGQPALGDLQTLVPELFTGSMTAPTETTFTFPGDGTVLSWQSAEWALDQSQMPDGMGLTTTGHVRGSVGYIPWSVPASVPVTDAASYGAYMVDQYNRTGYDYELLETASRVDPDGTPVWIVVAYIHPPESESHGLYHIEECRMAADGPWCVFALIHESDLEQGILLIRDSVTIRGIAPFIGFEEAIPVFFED